jgi:hypothetical protein
MKNSLIKMIKEVVQINKWKYNNFFLDEIFFIFQLF